MANQNRAIFMLFFGIIILIQGIILKVVRREKISANIAIIISILLIIFSIFFWYNFSKKSRQLLSTKLQQKLAKYYSYIFMISLGIFVVQTIVFAIILIVGKHLYRSQNQYYRMVSINLFELGKTEVAYTLGEEDTIHSSPFVTLCDNFVEKVVNENSIIQPALTFNRENFETNLKNFCQKAIENLVNQEVKLLQINFNDLRDHLLQYMLYFNQNTVDLGIFYLIIATIFASNVEVTVDNNDNTETLIEYARGKQNIARHKTIQYNFDEEKTTFEQLLDYYVVQNNNEQAVQITDFYNKKTELVAFLNIVWGKSAEKAKIIHQMFTIMIQPFL